MLTNVVNMKKKKRICHKSQCACLLVNANSIACLTKKSPVTSLIKDTIRKGCCP